MKETGFRYEHKLILASQSPRRREIMRMVGLEFDVCPSGCDEDIEYDGPADMVEKLALLKAEDVAAKLKAAEDTEHLLIGSDTTVYFEGQILGKPKSREEAFQMLRSMSGKTHRVYTAVAIIDMISGNTELFHEETDVSFFNLSDEEIKAYVDTDDPMDKAGAYGVQGRGAFLVKRIDGDYFTVVGLPIARLLQKLKKMM